MFSSSEQLHTGVCLNFLFHVCDLQPPCSTSLLSVCYLFGSANCCGKSHTVKVQTVEGFQRLFRYFFFTTELVGGFKLAYERYPV